MKKTWRWAFLSLVFLAVYAAADGAPIPFCQPGHCDPGYKQSIRKTANWIRVNVLREVPIDPPNRPKC